jgi:dGTPase
VKHNGPIIDGVPQAIRSYCRGHDLEVETYAGAEAQVASLADDIAYHSHDIDDGLRAGLFKLGDLAGAPLAGDAARQVLDQFTDVEEDRLVQETVRRLIGRLVSDLTDETRLRLAESGVETADDVRWHGAPVVAFSPAIGEANRALKAWLFDNMYHHERITQGRSDARRVVEDLFARFMADPSIMPPEWTRRADGLGDTGKARVVADYIAGMTDRFAHDEHTRTVVH